MRDFSARGPHKIRDRWHSTRYRVLRAPKQGGVVYTIDPVENPTQVRHIHRLMLKAVVSVDSPASAPAQDSPPGEEPVSEACSFDYDLAVFGQQPAGVASTSSSAPSESAVQVPVSTSTSARDCSQRGPPTVSRPKASKSRFVSPVLAPNSSPVALRCTARSTAGHHSNVHHLPRPAGGVSGAPAPMSSAVVALFRPWS